MKNYFRILFFLPATALMLGVAASLTGCTEVDDTLGLGLLPDEQQLFMGIATLHSDDYTETYTVLADSILTGNMSSALIGTYASDDFGTTRAGAVIQISPNGYNDPVFEDGAVADSIMLNLYITNIQGHNGKENSAQTFYIYEVTEDLDYDEIRFATFDADEVINPDPVFSFELDNVNTGMVSVKLASVDGRGEEYMERLFEADPALYDISNPIPFRELFKGFYIAPAGIEDESEMAVYTFRLASTSSYYDEFSYLEFFTSYYDSEEEEDAISSVTFDFIDTKVWTETPATSIGSYSHDYTGTPVETALNATEGGTVQAVTYVNGLGGVATRVHFTDALLDAIEALLERPDGQYSHIMINKAEMWVYLEGYVQGASAPLLDAAPQRAGMYYNMHPYKEVDGELELAYSDFAGGPYPFPDYYYPYENSGSYYLPYGGYLDRSNGYYKMDISSYITELINQEFQSAEEVDEEDKESRDVLIAPAISWLYSPREVALKGTGSDNPIKIELTYTLIK